MQQYGAGIPALKCGVQHAGLGAGAVKGLCMRGIGAGGGPCSGGRRRMGGHPCRSQGMRVYTLRQSTCSIAYQARALFAMNLLLLAPALLLIRHRPCSGCRPILLLTGGD